MTDDAPGPIEGLLRDEPDAEIEKEGSHILSDTEVPERSIKELLEETGDLPGETDNVGAIRPVRKKRSLGIG